MPMSGKTGRNRRKPSFDVATLEVLWTRLISTVDEAAAALVRTSFSTVVRESHDFSCVLTDDSRLYVHVEVADSPFVLAKLVQHS